MLSTMEPMNLGSPPSSPGSPNPNFLPAFLMGESQPTSPGPATSPGRTKTPLAGPRFPQNYGSHPTNLRQKLFNQSINEYTMQNTTYTSPTVEKSGPPKQGLFDSMEAKSSPILNSTMATLNEQPPFSPNESFSRIGNDSLNYSCHLQESRMAFQNNATSRFERIDTLWVTVFGFVPSATSLVLNQLSNCGTIVDKKYPSQGNWIHVKFSTPNEVAKALMLNGKCITNTVMVGVVPFHNKQDNNKENLENSLTSPIRARSLRTSIINQTPTGQHNVPQKSTGIVTKAMEYVFGW